MNVIIHSTSPAALVGVGSVLLLGVEDGAVRPPTPCAVEKVEHTIEGLVISARPVGRAVKRRVIRCQPDDLLATELDADQAAEALGALQVWGSDDGYAVALGITAPEPEPEPEEVPADA